MDSVAGEKVSRSVHRISPSRKATVHPEITEPSGRGGCTSTARTVVVSSGYRLKSLILR